MSKRVVVGCFGAMFAAAALYLGADVIHAAQAPPAVAPAPAAPVTPESARETLPSIGWVLVVVPLLQWAKKNPKITWIKDETVFWASGAAAILGQAGIHYSFDSVAGTFVITGLTHQAMGIVTKWAGQHLLYKHVKAMDAITQVAAALSKEAAASGG